MQESVTLEGLEACKKVSVSLETLVACKTVSVSLGNLDTRMRASVSLVNLFEVSHYARFGRAGGGHTPAQLWTRYGKTVKPKWDQLGNILGQR